MRRFFLFLFFLFLFGGVNIYAQDSNTDALPSNSKDSSQEQEFDFDEEEQDAQDDEQSRFDPLEGYNIWMSRFNANSDVSIAIIKGYMYVVPSFVREGIDNMFHLAFFPTSFANHLLQLKFKEATKQTLRVVVNVPVGIFGFFDVAKHIGLPRHSEDFGQTLGYWGVGSGFPVVLPFIGPSNLRDSLSMFADAYSDYVLYEKITPLDAMGLNVFYKFNQATFYIDYFDTIKQDAIGEPYYYFQNAYEQRRDYLIEH